MTPAVGRLASVPAPVAEGRAFSPVRIANAPEDGARPDAISADADGAVRRGTESKFRAGRPGSGPSRLAALERPAPQLTPGFALPESYLRWNRALAEHCLLNPPEQSGPVYLSVTPRILSATLEAEEGEVLSPEVAAQDLASAASSAYQHCILREPDKLWALAALGPDGLPHSVAFLALSVLAAYDMHFDEEAGPNAYYHRLASLLGCELQGGHPHGFDPVDFGHLWDHLSSWLEHRSGRALTVPGPDPGIRRYVAYPLGHVPLRQVDIEKLPDFFVWAGFEPGDKASPGVIGDALQRWASARGLVSRTGESALADERRPAVESQLSLELDAWDGAGTDRFGRRTGAVHIHLDFRHGQPQLFFLPRRPSAFPATFDAGFHAFEAEEEGWYDPLPIAPEDGPTLQRGFEWTCSLPRGQVSLHRAPSSAIALRPADFTGFLSQRGLPLGVKSAVLCTASLEASAEEFLSAVTGVRCSALDHPAVPFGWRLFSGILAKKSTPPPPGLEVLAVDSTATVTLRGGLRLGRRAAWLAGAPPTILVSGPKELAVTIDGRPATGDQWGLDSAGQLGVGPHIVGVGRVRRRLEVVEPEGKWDACAALAAQDEATRIVLALPPGAWVVIGARPDQVARAGTAEVPALLTASFAPMWAVSMGGRRTARVLCLNEHAIAPDTLDFRRRRPRPGSAAAVWACAVYDAHIRRARLGLLSDGTAVDELQAAWFSYWLAARGLKRDWRRLP